MKLNNKNCDNVFRVFLMFLLLVQNFRLYGSEFNRDLQLYDATCDFDLDYKVGLKDFVILSDSWKWKSWFIDPNNTYDGDYYNLCDVNWDLKVDFSDLVVFSRYWKVSLEDESIQLVFDKDPDNISGDFSVGIRNYPLQYSYHLSINGDQKTFPLKIGILNPSVSIKSYEYTNGINELKIYAIAPGKKFLIGRSLEVVFNNNLSQLDAGEFYPEEDYHVSGFYDPNSNAYLHLEFVDVIDYDRVLWVDDVNDLGEFEFILDPNELGFGVWNQLIITEIEREVDPNDLIDLNDKSFVRTKTGSSLPKNQWVQDVCEGFDVRAYVNDKTTAVIVCPNMRIGEGRKDVIRTWFQSNQNKGFRNICALFGNRATTEKIRLAFIRPNVESIMIISHGNRTVGIGNNAVQGTFFMADDGPIFANLEKDFSVVPWWYHRKPEEYEENGVSIAGWRMYNHPNLRYVFADFCNSGPQVMDPIVYDQMVPQQWEQEPDYTWNLYVQTSDMSFAFGIFPDSRKKLYCGWRSGVFSDGDMLGDVRNFNNFLKELYYQMGRTGTGSKSISESIAKAATDRLGNRYPYFYFSWVGDIFMSYSVYLSSN